MLVTCIVVLTRIWCSGATSALLFTGASQVGLDPGLQLGDVA
jgi:hypothetical protein